MIRRSRGAGGVSPGLTSGPLSCTTAVALSATISSSVNHCSGLRSTRENSNCSSGRHASRIVSHTKVAASGSTCRSAPSSRAAAGAVAAAAELTSTHLFVGISSILSSIALRSSDVWSHAIVRSRTLNLLWNLMVDMYPIRLCGLAYKG